MKVKIWTNENTAYKIGEDIRLMINTGEITEVITLTMSTEGGSKSHNAILIYR